MVFGSVPLFAYVVHVYLAHALSIVLRVATGQTLVGQFDTMRVQVSHPELLNASGYILAVVYVALDRPQCSRSTRCAAGSPASSAAAATGG